MIIYENNVCVYLDVNMRVNDYIRNHMYIRVCLCVGVKKKLRLLSLIYTEKHIYGKSEKKTYIYINIH